MAWLEKFLINQMVDKINYLIVVACLVFRYMNE